MIVEDQTILRAAQLWIVVDAFVAFFGLFQEVFRSTKGDPWRGRWESCSVERRNPGCM